MESLLEYEALWTARPLSRVLLFRSAAVPGSTRGGPRPIRWSVHRVHQRPAYGDEPAVLLAKAPRTVLGPLPRPAAAAGASAPRHHWQYAKRLVGEEAWGKMRESFRDAAIATALEIGLFDLDGAGSFTHPDRPPSTATARW